MSAAVAWILALLVYAAPPERLAAEPGWEETAEQRSARYAEIAADIAAVTYAPTAPVLYGGPRARAHTAALLVAVAVLESGLAADVDRGPCYRGRDGRGPRCDRGRSASCWQIRLEPGERTREGWTQADLFADRRKAIRVALRLMRGSFGLARARGRLDNMSPAEIETRLLDSYAGPGGHKLGAARLKLADKLFAKFPPPLDPVNQAGQSAFLLAPPSASPTAAQGAP